MEIIDFFVCSFFQKMQTESPSKKVSNQDGIILAGKWLVPLLHVFSIRLHSAMLSERLLFDPNVFFLAAGCCGLRMGDVVHDIPQSYPFCSRWSCDLCQDIFPGGSKGAWVWMLTRYSMYRLMVLFSVNMYGIHICVCVCAQVCEERYYSKCKAAFCWCEQKALKWFIKYSFIPFYSMRCFSVPEQKCFSWLIFEPQGLTDWLNTAWAAFFDTKFPSVESLLWIFGHI